MTTLDTSTGSELQITVARWQIAGYRAPRLTKWHVVGRQEPGPRVWFRTLCGLLVTQAQLEEGEATKVWSFPDAPGNCRGCQHEVAVGPIRAAGDMLHEVAP